MKYLVPRAEQEAHIKEHLAAFRDLTGRETVEEYFEEYYEQMEREYEPGELYLRLCSDLDLTPRKVAKGAGARGRGAKAKA